MPVNMEPSRACEQAVAVMSELKVRSLTVAAPINGGRYQHRESESRRQSGQAALESGDRQESVDEVSWPSFNRNLDRFQ